MVGRTMTTVRFHDDVRRLINILSSEEMESMNTVIEKAVKYYYEHTSFQRLAEMIFEYEGRIGKSTGLKDVLKDGRIADALLIVKRNKAVAHGVAKRLIEKVEKRILLIGE